MQRLSVAKAAKVLGVTEQAIYARVKRDTIKHTFGENGEINVLLDEDEIHPQTDGQPLDNALVNGYIETLKSEIEDWKEEARRKDHIIMALTNRIPELEAPSDSSGQAPSDATEAPVSHSKTQSRGDVPPEAQNRSWWQRLFS